MTIRQDVDALIDWSEANKPGVVQFQVNCRPRSLAKFAKKIPGGHYMYRGKELLGIKPKKVKPQQLEIVDERTTRE